MIDTIRPGRIYKMLNQMALHRQTNPLSLRSMDNKTMNPTIRIRMLLLKPPPTTP